MGEGTVKTVLDNHPGKVETYPAAARCFSGSEARFVNLFGYLRGDTFAVIGDRYDNGPFGHGCVKRYEPLHGRAVSAAEFGDGVPSVGQQIEENLGQFADDAEHLRQGGRYRLSPGDGCRGRQTGRRPGGAPR